MVELVILICFIAFLACIFKISESLEADNKKITQQEIEATLFELLQNQNYLNNAAFAARKALIQEALECSHGHSQGDLNDRM